MDNETRKVWGGLTRNGNIARWRRCQTPPWSQARLGAACGVSGSAVSQWETGATAPDPRGDAFRLLIAITGMTAGQALDMEPWGEEDTCESS